MFYFVSAIHYLHDLILLKCVVMLFLLVDRYVFQPLVAEYILHVLLNMVTGTGETLPKFFGRVSSRIFNYTG